MLYLREDLRVAFRSFRRAPLHALSTALILGVGIGAVTLMFSVLNASILRPLPFPDGARLVWFWKASADVPQNSASYDDFRDYRAGLDGFEDVAAYQLFSPRPLLTGVGESVRVRGNQVTPNLFPVLGVAPALGRGFSWDEAVVGGPAVTILSHGLWQGEFGADPGIIGRVITLDGEPTTVVGVMPPRFAFPDPAVQLWLPTRAGAPATQGRGNNNFFIIGRLKPGVSLVVAQTQVDAAAAHIQEANPDFASWFHWVQPLHTVLYGDSRTMLLLLLGIVALVPLVACANVASLALTRATARTAELATRRALGASNARIARQLLVEHGLLALAGGALGLGVALVGGGLLRVAVPGVLPRLDEIGVDGTVLGFALIVSLLTVPLFGMVPAWRGASFDLAGALRSGGGRGGSQRQGRFRPALVVAQVALSLTLLIASGALYRSFLRMNQVDPRFDYRGLLTATVQLPTFKYSSPEELRVAWSVVLDRLVGMPGVAGVAWADWLPVTPGAGPWNSLIRPGRSSGRPDDGWPGRRKFVNADYFRVLGVRILAGRPFQDGDRPDSEPIMILSQTLASSMFPGEDAVGQSVMLWGQSFRVVGVAASVDEAGVADEGRPAFFLSTTQFPQDRLRLALRAAGGDPLALAGALRMVLRAQDADITLGEVRTMRSRIADTLSGARFRAALVGVFALVGLLLAGVGLYGVLAYVVAMRRHEIGIRMSMGAGPGVVLRLVLREAMSMVGLGLVLGLALGTGATLLLRGLLFGVYPTDPLTLGGASLILLAVAAAAALVPALRAVRVSPLEALRSG